MYYDYNNSYGLHTYMIHSRDAPDHKWRYQKTTRTEIIQTLGQKVWANTSYPSSH